MSTEEKRNGIEMTSSDKSRAGIDVMRAETICMRRDKNRTD